MPRGRNWLMTVAVAITAAATLTVAAPASHASVPPTSTDVIRPLITVPASASPASASAVAAVRHAAGHVQAGTLIHGPAAIPTQDLSRTPTFVDDNAIYQNSESNTSFVIRPITSGMQTLIDISGSASPTQFTFSMPLPPGTHYQVNPDGSADIVTARGMVIGTLAKPWARDANLNSVPTHYTLKGNTIVQTVSHQGAVYPVVADPSVTWHWWGYQIQFTKFETQIIAGGIGLVSLYFGWQGWPAIAAWAAQPLASWATRNGYCLAINWYWNGYVSPWVYRC
jgi:hypothetical protein